MFARIKAVLATSFVLAFGFGDAALAHDYEVFYPLTGERVFPQSIALDGSTGGFSGGAPDLRAVLRR